MQQWEEHKDAESELVRWEEPREIEGNFLGFFKSKTGASYARIRSENKILAFSCPSMLHNKLLSKELTDNHEVKIIYTGEKPTAKGSLKLFEVFSRTLETVPF